MKEKTFELIKNYLQNNKAKIQRSSTFENGFEFDIEVEDITIIGNITATSTQEKTPNGKRTTKFDLKITFYKNNDFVCELSDNKTVDESVTENIVVANCPAVDIYNICVDKIKKEMAEVASLESINEILENNL